MEARNFITSELYNKIYNAIIAAAEEHGIENEDDTSFGFYFEDGDWTVEGTASLPVEYIDDSFDHAFGTEYCGHFEHSFDEMPEIDEIFVYFGEDGEEVEFDGNVFYSQFNVTERKLRNGDVIKAGDIVLVPTGYVNGWKKAIFDYYNTETGEWFCREIYKYSGKVATSPYHYRKVLVANDENISKFKVA